MSNIIDLLGYILPVSLGTLSFMVSLIVPVIINALKHNDTKKSTLVKINGHEVILDDLDAKELIELLEKIKIEKKKDEN